MFMLSCNRLGRLVIMCFHVFLEIRIKYSAFQLNNYYLKIRSRKIKDLSNAKFMNGKIEKVI